MSTREKQFCLRVNSAEESIIRGKALEANIKPIEYIRRAALNGRITAHFSIEEARMLVKIYDSERIIEKLSDLIENKFPSNIDSQIVSELENKLSEANEILLEVRRYIRSTR